MKRTVQQTAKWFDVTPKTVYNWIDRGLPYTTQWRGTLETIIIDSGVATAWLARQRGGVKDV